MLVVFVVDEQTLFKKRRQQDDQLTKLAAHTRSKCASARQQIAMLKRYLKLCEDGLLAKYIPRSAQYNGQPYQEYEREFLMHYRTIQNARGADWQC